MPESVTCTFAKFQFLYGTIKISNQTITGDWTFSFQFLYGTIKIRYFKKNKSLILKFLASAKV